MATFLENENFRQYIKRVQDEPRLVELVLGYIKEHIYDFEVKDLFTEQELEKLHHRLCDIYCDYECCVTECDCCNEDD